MIDLSYWYFFLLALFGAVIANATGAGGGVVFVPAFSLLGISEQSIIATSFSIQCFGMTAGMFAWNKYANSQRQDSTSNHLWKLYWHIVAIFAVPSVFGLVIGQYALRMNATDDIRVLFKCFSFVFGLSILVTTWFIANRRSLSRESLELSNIVVAVFMFVGIVGGTITAWLSIGVGELIAVTLILMSFPVRFSIGVAVTVSAVTVWVGVQKYIWFEPFISLEILVFAAPAALIGGAVANKVTIRFSAIQLKIFIATWILISAIAM